MTDNELLTSILEQTTRTNDLLELAVWGLFFLSGITFLRIMTLRSTI